MINRKLLEYIADGIYSLALDISNFKSEQKILISKIKKVEVILANDINKKFDISFYTFNCIYKNQLKHDKQFDIIETKII